MKLCSSDNHYTTDKHGYNHGYKHGYDHGDFCCTWPTTSFLQRALVKTTATTFLSTSLVGSFKHCKHSPTSGFQIIIYTWYPLIYCLLGLFSLSVGLLTHFEFDCTIPWHSRASFWSKISQFGKNLYKADTSL